MNCVSIYYTNISDIYTQLHLLNYAYDFKNGMCGLYDEWWDLAVNKKQSKKMKHTSGVLFTCVKNTSKKKQWGRSFASMSFLFGMKVALIYASFHVAFWLSVDKVVGFLTEKYLRHTRQITLYDGHRTSKDMTKHPSINYLLTTT